MIVPAEKETKLLPGDLVTPVDSGASLWLTDNFDVLDDGIRIARMQVGDKALVISVGKQFSFVVFNDVVGYVYSFRVAKVI